MIPEETKPGTLVWYAPAHLAEVMSGRVWSCLPDCVVMDRPNPLNRGSTLSVVDSRGRFFLTEREATAAALEAVWKRYDELQEATGRLRQSALVLEARLRALRFSP